MPGAIPTNLHRGSQSETLADYFFGTVCGPVTPVRRQDDFGIDLFATFTEREGKLSWVRESFGVQVKSDSAPWILEGEQVRWLVETKSPLFLCVVDKSVASIKVFHTFGRFSFAPWRLPRTLTLQPGSGTSGTAVDWSLTGTVDLSAPIVEATVLELLDQGRQAVFRAVIEDWLRHER